MNRCALSLAFACSIAAALSGGKGAGQSGPSSAFSSPFGVSAMLGTDQAWLDALWTSRQINEDYYADSITMLSMIVMSGNRWAP